MKISQFVQGKKFKNFMTKLYGWGASVVIIGALFKIEHFKGASIMLMLGLGTEAIIFFFSAFEPPHVEPDWTLVYPELAGMASEDFMIEDHSRDKKGGDAVSQELDKMLAEAKIGPELIESLGKSFHSLSENTSKLSDISSATVATNEYIDNVKQASKSVDQLSDSYKKTSQELSKEMSISENYYNNLKSASDSAQVMSSAFNKNAETIHQTVNATDGFVNSINAATSSVNDLKLRYQKSTESLTKASDAIDFSDIDTKAFIDQLQKVSKNLSALNAVYELQLQGSSEQLEKTNLVSGSINQFISSLDSSSDFNKKLKDNVVALNNAYEQQLVGTSDQVEKTKILQEGMARFIDNLKVSAENTQNFQQELHLLTKNITALNNVYGNMLSAMNVNTNK
jgi:gliding motility-associated protein GldL